MPHVCSKCSSGEMTALRSREGVFHMLVVSIAGGAGDLHMAVLKWDQAHVPMIEKDVLHKPCCQPHSGGYCPMWGAERGFYHPALLWLWMSSSPAFYSWWNLPEVPRDMNFVCSCRCWTVSEINLFQCRSYSRRFWGALLPTESQGLLITCPSPLLSCVYLKTARNFTSAFL